MKLSRRLFLGGAGAAIALPLFESLLPRVARGADPPAPPRRFLAFFAPNGVDMPSWTPVGEGTGWVASPILEPLIPYRSKVMVVSGVGNRPGQPDQGGDHAAGTGAFLTTAHVLKTDGAGLRAGKSVDQVAADVLCAGLPYRSLELGIEGGSSVGGCDLGYSCAYARNISWQDAGTPRPKLTSPRVAFDRMFAGFDPDLTAQEIQKRLHYRTSILDYATGEADRLRARLGRTDRAKLDQYLAGVRELELRLARPGAPCLPGMAPGELEYPEHVKFMLDLIALVLRCDQTRVATFMLGNAISNHAHTHLGIPDSHHDLSHHAGDPTKRAQFAEIARWEVEQLAYLIGRLEAYQEVDGSSILDHTVLYFSSDVGDGNLHTHVDLPVVVAGGAGGALATGRHVRYTDQPTMGDLFIALLAAVGVTVGSFGDEGTRPLPGILA
jgi:hypothetical protein